MVTLTVSNRIAIPTKSLPKRALSALKSAFRHENTTFYRLQSLGKSTWKTPRQIPTFEVGPGRITLPRGGEEKALRVLENFKLPYQIRDETVSRPVFEPFQFDPDFVFRPYQERAIQQILEHKTCLVKGAAGSGKTEIILGAIAKAQERAGIVVCKSDLFDQWLERIELRLGIPKRQIGKWRGGRKKTIGDQVTVIMLQSGAKTIPQLQGYFGFIANDEVHHAAAQTNYRLVDSFDSRYRVGASATIKRQDLRHPLTLDLFGKVRFEIDRKDLEDRGYLQKVELVIVPTSFYFDYLHDDLLSEVAPTVKNAAHRASIAKAHSGTENGYSELLSAQSQDGDRNNLIYSHVRKELDDGSICAVFVKRVEQAQLWRNALERAGIPCALLLGSGHTGKREAQRLIQKLRSREIRVAVGTTFEEGTDIPAMDAGFVAYRTLNAGALEQMAGRLARKAEGKSKARLYYFWDRRIGRFAGDPKRLQKLFGSGTVLVPTATRVKA